MTIKWGMPDVSSEGIGSEKARRIGGGSSSGGGGASMSPSPPATFPLESDGSKPPSPAADGSKLTSVPVATRPRREVSADLEVGEISDNPKEEFACVEDT